MEDIISQGQRRPPGGWRRRLVVVAVFALVGGLVLVEHLPNGTGTHAHQHRSGQVPRAITLTVISREVPAGITGQSVPVQVAVRLPRTGSQPNWFWPAKGRVEPILGLPSYQF